MQDNMEEKEEKQRTLQQNKALHKWFDLVAETLNEAGLDMRKTLKQEIEISWTRSAVKEYLWRPVMRAMIGKESTTQMSTTDIDKIFNVLNRHLGEKLKVHQPFPSIENILLEMEYKNHN